MSIKYCSLEEAWGPVYAGRYNQDISYDGSMVPLNGGSSIVPFQNNGNQYETMQSMPIDNFEQTARPSYDDIRNYISDDEDDNSPSPICKRMMNHFRNCKKCQRTLLKKYKDKVKEQVQVEEGFMNLDQKDGNYTDVIIMLLVGVFIILVLDSFVRLGKRMG